MAGLVMVVGAEKVIHRIKGAGMRSCDRLTSVGVAGIYPFKGVEV